MWTEFYGWLFPEPQPATEEAAGWLAGELSRPAIDIQRELLALFEPEDQKDAA